CPRASHGNAQARPSLNRDRKRSSKRSSWLASMAMVLSFFRLAVASGAWGSGIGLGLGWCRSLAPPFLKPGQQARTPEGAPDVGVGGVYVAQGLGAEERRGGKGGAHVTARLLLCRRPRCRRRPSGPARPGRRGAPHTRRRSIRTAYRLRSSRRTTCQSPAT